MEKGNLTDLTGKVNPLKALPYALQQILAMFVSNIVPVMMICAAAVPVLSPEQVSALSQNAMIIAGIATFIQATPLWRFGSGLPIFMGVSFTFVVPLCAIACKHGYGAVVGSVIVGGFLEGILGLTARYWKKAVAPIVSATVVTGIGLSLLSTAARSFGGGYLEDFGAVHNLVIGTVTIITCILWQVFTKGIIRQLSILIGMVAGYIASLLFGIVSFDGASSLRWFTLPVVLPFKPVFRLDAIISIFIVYLVSATETMGDVSALANGALRRHASSHELSGALTVDGFGSMVGGLLGVPPVTSYSENIGLTILTKVVNRNVARIGALIMIACGFLPHVGFFIRTIPNPVVGGVLVVVIGQIVVSGFQMVSKAGFTTRNKLIASLSLAIGVGFTASTETGIWSSMPVAVQSIFSQNVVAVIFVLALLLNLVLPKNMEEENT